LGDGTVWVFSERRAAWVAVSGPQSAVAASGDGVVSVVLRLLVVAGVVVLVVVALALLAIAGIQRMDRR